MKKKRKRASGSESRVFAGEFLRKSTSKQVPMGRYDPKAQVYVHAKTGKPVFTPTAVKASKTEKQLSERQLANLLRKGMFVDLRQLDRKAAFGAWCTLSALTTYSTTSCCPIVTDSARDVGCDDTPSNPSS